MCASTAHPHVCLMRKVWIKIAWLHDNLKAGLCVCVCTEWGKATWKASSTVVLCVFQSSHFHGGIYGYEEPDTQSHVIAVKSWAKAKEPTNLGCEQNQQKRYPSLLESRRNEDTDAHHCLSQGYYCPDKHYNQNELGFGIGATFVCSQLGPHMKIRCFPFLFFCPVPCLKLCKLAPLLQQISCLSEADSREFMFTAFWTLLAASVPFALIGWWPMTHEEKGDPQNALSTV